MNALFLSLLLAQSYYTPTEAEAVFQEANAAYGRGEYAAARERYQRLVEHGNATADVLYNLGTAALAEGKLGEAVLALERARRFGGAPDVEGNLALARARQLDQVTGETAEEPFVARLGDVAPHETAIWLALGAWATGFLLLTVSRFLTSRPKALLGGLGVLALAGVALPAGALVAAQSYAARTYVEGVVQSPTLAARELPSSSARVSFEVHAGLKVRLLEPSGEFVKIRLPNGLEAWAERQAVVRL